MPEIEIERPRKPNHVVHVGDPLSPLSFMADIKVSEGSGTPVTGIPMDWFALDTEGDVVTATNISRITKGHYFGVFLPPVKALRTNWVDLRACLSAVGSCDTRSEALRYAPPGSTSILLLHDASGSMADVDMPGDFSRLKQAKQAAELLVQLAQVGDYYSIMDSSAHEIDRPADTCPPGCVPDVRLVYPKIEITDSATQIPAVQSAIGAMSAREWMSLGEGLRQAQLEVLSTPYTDNNKVITVRSDGEENVTPYYDDVAPDLDVVVTMMGFSGDAE